MHKKYNKEPQWATRIRMLVSQQACLSARKGRIDKLVQESRCRWATGEINDLRNIAHEQEILDDALHTLLAALIKKFEG